ncbi:MAG: tyrosine-protein phosphatase [Collinsella sp.]
MLTVYKSLLDNDGASIARVMTALDSDGAPGCALFHCRAGKDRIGRHRCSLLGLAGVSDDDIVADYAATQRYLGRGLRAQRVATSIACAAAPRAAVRGRTVRDGLTRASP